MAHIRKNCVNVSTTYSAPQDVFKIIDDYRFSTRKESRAAAMTELILLGVKYKKLVEKKRERMSAI